MNPLTLPPAPATRSKAIVIACQGGGSHTAFTGGVLQTLLSGLDRSRYRIAGLSGTSGGALCAAIAWFGLLQDDPKRGAQLLESFWREISARQPMDAFSNTFLVLLQRSAGYLALPEISPYQVPATGQDYLASIIERHIDFAQVRKSVKPDSPRLMVGAVEVRSGEFTAFHSHHAEPEKQISVDALLASAAIPELFRAVEVGSGVYWDGLFSQNPPIRGFLAGLQDRDAKPDEIWVIQINPDKRDREPRLTSDITDRRNELAGNLSLKQELFFLEQANDWLARGWLTADHFKHVEVRHIRLSRDLDYPSKLDRSPSFINDLLDEGRRAGADFLDQLGKTGT
ncbi:MAG: patatin-like phospholipase family protein [Dechloromonas sp.]|uniref:Patatin-like phospholipase family protein n=1 Tax=Candidatus Dechloromonas phosphorivorans TaxID=2899244 RepID=A0A9D7LVU3_9RHOO|nr:patatin-like phospholipase family protein [Candidatus Dechloromonas phosphorivorans]